MKSYYLLRKRPDAIVREIHAIRRAIAEREKSMSREELAEYYRKKDEALSKEFGIKFYKNVEEALAAKQLR